MHAYIFLEPIVYHSAVYDYAAPSESYSAFSVAAAIALVIG